MGSMIKDRCVYIRYRLFKIKGDICIGCPIYVGIGATQRVESAPRNYHFNNIIAKTKRDLKLEFKHKGYHQVIFKSNLTRDQAMKIEIVLIKKFGRKDLRTGTLVNFTDGGEGMQNVTLATRLKLSKAHKGKKNSPEARRKLSVSMRGNKNGLGYKHTLESRLKMSRSQKGRKFSKEHCAKLTAWQVGKKLPLSHRLKISKSLKGNKRRLGCKWTKAERSQRLKFIRDPKNRKRNSLTTKRNWRNPVLRKKFTLAIRRGKGLI